MLWIYLLGCVMTGWVVLAMLGNERQHRRNELRHQFALRIAEVERCRAEQVITVK